MRKFVCVVCALCVFLSVKAQSMDRHIRITTTKTSSLIFPFAIKHVDRGTKDVLVQQVTDADNLLFVKASVPGFKETNLSVVTADGQLYSFTVTYDSMPTVLVYKLTPDQRKKDIWFRDEVMNPAEIDLLSKIVKEKHRSVRGVRTKKWNISAAVTGVYIKDNVLFFQLEINNRSSINYNLDFFRLYIRDIKKSKRTASQEIELKPLSVPKGFNGVKAKQRIKLVVPMEKFTIPDAKHLVIQMMEENGDRHLSLVIPNKRIIAARSL